MVEQSPDQPAPAGSPADLSRRELIRGAIAAGGFGTAMRWNRPLVEKVMATYHPSTCTCDGSSLPPPPPCDHFGHCRNHAQAITFGCKGKCGGSMCHKSGRHCVNESKWTCVNHSWRRDTLTALGCG